MSFEGKMVVRAIYIEANSASSWNGKFDLKILLNDQILYERENINHSSKAPLQTYGAVLDGSSADTGKIKFVFSNVNCGLNIGRIGVLVEESY